MTDSLRSIPMTTAAERERILGAPGFGRLQELSLHPAAIESSAPAIEKAQ